MKHSIFFKKYSSEKQCRKAFKQMREEIGIECKKCHNMTHYWRESREEWECKRCFHRTRLRAGTVMHASKLPFYYWFFGMHILTCSKKSVSAKEVQRQLGHKRYQPIWEMMHKLRLVMGLRDMNYRLADEVELDEGYFETVTEGRNPDEPLKRGRGSQKQTAVLVAAESAEVEDEYRTKKYSTDKKVRFIKMKVIDSLEKDTISQEVGRIIEEESKVVTDKNNSYNDLHENYEHVASVIPKKMTGKVLPWVHIAISNAKRLFLDVHHKIDSDFLQSYLNEFCYKFNRRYFDDIFLRLLKTSVMYKWNYLGD